MDVGDSFDQATQAWFTKVCGHELLHTETLGRGMSLTIYLGGAFRTMFANYLCTARDFSFKNDRREKITPYRTLKCQR